MAYEQKPGSTASIANGGEYDDALVANSANYTNITAEGAATATLAATIATAQAVIATTGANTATAQAVIATTGANTATAQAGIATTGANTATAQAGIATTGATTATAQAVIATAQAGVATGAASTATTQAGIATTGATTATAQAVIATTSATTATTQAGIAATQATNAASSATAAAASATTATTQAGIAATQATNAASSATAAAASATTATTQAGIATTGATTATTQASIATTQATNAASSATAAAAARDQALAAFDNFDDKYLGEKAADPSVDNDGNPLVTGALYFNNVSDVMKVYTGTVWTAAYVSSAGVLLVANNLSDVQSVVTARSNLGLGTIATQAASAVAITGGAIDGTAIGNTTRSTAKVTTLNATGAVSLAASTSSLVPLSIAVGTAPSAPVDGDIWVEPTGMFVKNSTYVHQLDFDTNTTGVLARTAVTITGSGATMSCSSVKVLLYSTGGFAGDFKSYIVPAATGLALTDNALNALIVSYNGGNPVFSVTTDLSVINGSSVVGAATLYRIGTEVHHQSVDWGLATASTNNKKSLLIYGIQRASGLSINESTGRVITLTAGSLWYASSEYTEPAITSAFSNCEFWYHVAGVWTNSLVSTYNNNQYDNGTNLVTLSGAGTQYAVNWVYRYLDGDSLPKLAYVLGTGNYNLAQAQASAPPAPPAILTSMAILVGRIVVAQAAVTATQIDSAFTAVFAGTTVADHNDLANLQGGTALEYFHLTSAEYTGTGTGTFVKATSPTLSGTVAGAYTLGGTPTLNAVTLGGTVSGGGNQINNVVIGATTPLAGNFTTLGATGQLTLNTSVGSNIDFQNGGGVSLGRIFNDAGYLNLQASANVNGLRLEAPARVFGRINGVTITDTSSTGLAVTGTVTSTTDAAFNGVVVGRGSGNVASNTAVGVAALQANTTGTNNLGVGYQALASNLTGTGNSAVGTDSMLITTGSANTALGSASLRLNTTGNYNTALGFQAGFSTTTASNNTAVGTQAAYSNTTGAQNYCAGYQAGYTNSTGNWNTFVGTQAGYLSTGTQNTFVGANGSNGAGYAITTGSKNTILGGYNGNQGGLDIRTASNYIVLSDGDGNPRQIIDASGNLGLGVTPSASSGTSFNTGRAWFGALQSGPYVNAYMSSNSYPTGSADPGSAVWRYKDGVSGDLGAAFKYEQTPGGHTWNNAPSGTAGNAVTFTQAMTLDASGNLLVGQTGAAIQNSNSCSFNNYLNTYLTVSHVNGTATGTYYAAFGYNGTAIGSITQAGTTGVLYNVTSDYRLKANQQPLTEAGNFIDALKPTTWTWTSDGRKDAGFIAHEFQAVCPNAVTGVKDEVGADGKPKYQAMQASSSEVIANLVAELQSLRKRIAVLEAK